MAIPVENVYYLLCYAWDNLEEKDQVNISVDDRVELLDLFARVLIHGTHILLKRGIEKNYVPETLEMAGVKGKVELSETLKSGIFLKQRAICSIDEFSGDILSNQILLSTLYRLIRTRDLNKQNKKNIKPLLWMLSGIRPIELHSRLFGQVRLHRNNRFYSFLLKVCQMIYENTLPTEKPGEWKFMDFMRDSKKMSTLFEAFMRNFYKRHFPNWRVYREQLKWQFAVQDESHQAYIPVMNTDISIVCEAGKIIIDTKYYQEAMALNYDKEKIHSGNLYQIFSYLMNQHSQDPESLKTRGMLLYPTTSNEIDLNYRYNQHPIEIKTVNLNTHWTLIEKRLKEIVLPVAERNHEKEP